MNILRKLNFLKTPLIHPKIKNFDFTFYVLCLFKSYLKRIFLLRLTLVHSYTTYHEKREEEEEH